jgi:SAM-dependent methyltransferase
MEKQLGIRLQAREFARRHGGGQALNPSFDNRNLAMAIANQLKLQLRRYLPASLHERMARTYRFIKGTPSEPSIPQIPNHLLTPPPELKFVGDGDFHAVGNEFLALFTRLADLQPSHRVLDVGCGVGRMAVPLLDFLSPEGCYEGFDVVPGAVDWCRQNISARNPRFRFQLADIRNEYYYVAGKYAAEDYVFPYADRSFDLVILTSVFTHLLPAAAANYLKQIRRVLKPEGRCFSTWLIMNDESRSLIAGGQSALPLVHPYHDVLSTNPSAPLEGIGFDEDRVSAMYQDAGLVQQAPTYLGQWCGRPDGVTFQDVVIACRPRD